MSDFKDWFWTQCDTLNKDTNLAYSLAERAWDKQQAKIDELQKRIDVVAKYLESDLKYVENDYRGNFEFLQMAMIRCLKDDIKALRGDE